MRIAVLVSGRGTNLEAITRAISENRCNASIVGVVSDRKTAKALEFARAHQIPAFAVPLKKGDDRQEWNVRLAAAVSELEPDVVVLAGFMRVLGKPLLQRFPGRIVNVHPALLPSFKGHDAPEQAVTARVKVSGCTVHVVDEGVDTGPILAQAAVPVLQDDTPDRLHERIQIQEHLLLPAVIDAIAKGLITLSPLVFHSPFADVDTSMTLVSPNFATEQDML